MKLTGFLRIRVRAAAIAARRCWSYQQDAWEYQGRALRWAGMTIYVLAGFTPKVDQSRIADPLAMINQVQREIEKIVAPKE